MTNHTAAAPTKTLRSKDPRAFYKTLDPIDIDWTKLPVTVRLAFCVARDTDDVWTALRMVRKMGGADVCGYLGGCLLPTDWEDSLGTFQAIQQSAQEFSDRVDAAAVSK